MRIERQNKIISKAFIAELSLTFTGHTLDFSYSFLEKDVIDMIIQMKNVSRLYLVNTNITDDDLAKLLKATHINIIDVCYCNITDQSLPNFLSLDRFCVCNVSFTNISESCKKEILQKMMSRPETKYKLHLSPQILFLFPGPLSRKAFAT